MAFRGLLEATGVIPLAYVAPASTPGLRLGQESGVWISGQPSVTDTPGLALLQSMGVWITGAGVSVEVRVQGGGLKRVFIPAVGDDEVAIAIAIAMGVLNDR